MFTGSVVDLVKEQFTEDEDSEIDDSAWSRYRNSVAPAANETDPSNLVVQKTWYQLLFGLDFLIIGILRIAGDYGAYLVYMILPSLMERLGFQATDGASMAGIVGISNLIGGMTSGWILTKLKIGSLLGTGICMIFVAAAIFALPYCSTYTHFGISCAVQGFFTAPYTGQQTTQLVTIFGMENLTTAFGLSNIFRGIGSFAGPVVSGFIVDLTDSYFVPCIFQACLVTVSALMSILLYYRHEKKTRAC